MRTIYQAVVTVWLYYQALKNFCSQRWYNLSDFSDYQKFLYENKSTLVCFYDWDEGLFDFCDIHL